jgi:DNA-binding response OmpR family regulator
MSGKKILLVEDDPLLIKMYQTKLQIEGFEVKVASDGEMGWEMVQAEIPDFMVLDLMMPKLSGMELLKKIKADSKLKLIPTIMLTNMNRQEELELAKTLGVKEFLLKANYTPGEIVDKIRGYLN